MWKLIIGQTLIIITILSIGIWLVFTGIKEFQSDPCIRWSMNGIKQEFCLGK